MKCMDDNLHALHVVGYDPSIMIVSGVLTWQDILGVVGFVEDNESAHQHVGEPYEPVKAQAEHELPEDDGEEVGTAGDSD